MKEFVHTLWMFIACDVFVFFFRTKRVSIYCHIFVKYQTFFFRCHLCWCGFNCKSRLWITIAIYVKPIQTRLSTGTRVIKRISHPQVMWSSSSIRNVLNSVFLLWQICIGFLFQWQAPCSPQAHTLNRNKKVNIIVWCKYWPQRNLDFLIVDG